MVNSVPSNFHLCWWASGELEDILMLLRGDEGVVNGDIRAFEKITKQIPQIGPYLKLRVRFQKKMWCLVSALAKG